MFCFRWWLTIHQWTEFSISNSTYVQISYVKYIPLLCRIWPDVIQKSSLFYQQSLGMIQTRVPIFLNSLYSIDDKIRATVQLITYTVPQNCLSLFTISQITLNTVPPLSDLAQRLSFRFFFLEGHHLSKSHIGRQCNSSEKYLALFCCCSWDRSNPQVNKNPMTGFLSHTFIYSSLMLCNRSKKYRCHIE